jgi:ADP-heptose:LPS heptosyltransferase
MGDVAMTVPVLRALTLQYPGVKVTVVSKAFFKPLFKNIPNVAFFAAEPEGRHKGLAGLLRLYRELASLKPDAVADLHNVLRSKIITALFTLSGKKTATTNKARSEKKALTRTNNKIFKPLTPVTQRHAQVFKQLDFPVDLSVPVFPEREHLADEVLQITGQKIGKWIGIAPFAQHKGKVYPQNLMQQVINKLAEKPNYKLFLFGGKNEQVLLQGYASDKENCIVMAGKIGFEQEIALISNLDVMLSMDSGNSHIAAMLGVKVVTLWGATHPYTGFAPFNQPLENALTADRAKYPLLPTSVYGNKEVEGYEDVMATIKPEAVVNKVEEVLLR